MVQTGDLKEMLRGVSSLDKAFWAMRFCSFFVTLPVWKQFVSFKTLTLLGAEMLYQTHEQIFISPKLLRPIHTVRFFLIATAIPSIATNGLHRTQ